MDDQRVEHTVCYDATGEISQRYDVRGFPTSILVNRAGKIVWHGFPSEDTAGVEAQIERAIGK